VVSGRTPAAPRCPNRRGGTPSKYPTPPPQTSGAPRFPGMARQSIPPSSHRPVARNAVLGANHAPACQGARGRVVTHSGTESESLPWDAETCRLEASRAVARPSTGSSSDHVHSSRVSLPWKASGRRVVDGALPRRGIFTRAPFSNAPRPRIPRIERVAAAAPGCYCPAPCFHTGDRRGHRPATRTPHASDRRSHR